EIAKKEGNLAAAISSFEEALTIAKLGNHLVNQEICNRELYELNKELGQTSKALDHLEKSKMLSDSIKGDEVKKQLQLLDFRNQIWQDSIQIENVIEKDRLQYQASLRSRNNLVILLFGIALSLLTFTYFLFKAKREKEGLLSEVQKQHQKVSQMNQEIIRTKDQLVVQEKLASLGQLTAGIAHEIKNPLNFITNFSEDSAELIDELDENLLEVKNLFPTDKKVLIQSSIEDLRLNLNDIKDNGLRVDQIVNNMMNHARDAESIQHLEDINSLIEINTNFAYNGFRAINRNFRAQIVNDFASDLPKVNIYPQELGRVVLNLINNACYATHLKQEEQNDFAPQIKISTAIEKEQLKISVTDNGVGIPQKVQDDIFNPFFTTKPTGEGNIGLGLSISYDIITQLHKGQLMVDSSEGLQTTFTILIPMKT
ncbi:MAG: ATP-binding protein, partial [Bacteroidota bacterium]